MKRRDLIKRLEKKGWWLLNHGGNHDIYTNGKDIEPIKTQRDKRNDSKINNQA